MVLLPPIFSSLFFIFSSFQHTVKPTEIITYQLGSTAIQLEQTSYEGSSSLFIVHVHDNELTAKTAADTVLQQLGGILLSIKNRQDRLMNFNYKGRYYFFDPNRIFTPTGRTNTLTELSCYNKPSAVELKKFADYFLAKIAPQQTIISIHNNTNNAYSILSYKQGEYLYKDAKAMHINPEQDIDDFFITTSLTIYNKLKKENYNAVLQHNIRTADDGSLSIYYGRKNKSYVNVEAEHGHLQQQTDMLLILAQIL
jgi:hypothetical protein